jgi:hypothetical protein
MRSMLPAVAALLGTAILALPARAEPGAPADGGTTPNTAAAPPRAAKQKVPFERSELNWVHSTTTQTLGVGADYQSDNPTYEQLLDFRLRYYFYDDDVDAFSVRARALVFTELTNSDYTSERGEILLDDSLLSFVWGHEFIGGVEDRLALGIGPQFVLPTSEASYESGVILRVGPGVVLERSFPLRPAEDFFQRARLGFRTYYHYQFSRANVPESSSLNRARLSVDGHSAPNDQLRGGALAQHQILVHPIGYLDIFRDRVSFEFEVGVDAQIRHPLVESEVCGTVATGCATPSGLARPEDTTLLTYLNLEIGATVVGDWLSLALGYENFTSALGADGQRRSPLWSPATRFNLTVGVALDELYRATTPTPATSQTASR